MSKNEKRSLGKCLKSIKFISRDVLPKNVRKILIWLCLFFNAICNKVIDPQKLDELENKIIVILCQLKMYFPRSFIDIMIHLIVRRLILYWTLNRCKKSI
ncbi:hypothetical protein CR513_11000, partial [Mucuna pruriens]